MAADSISYEAYWRVRDPVYGSVGIISRLQQEIRTKEHELAKTQALIAVHAARTQAGGGGGGHFAEAPGGAVVLDDDTCQQRLLGWDQAAAAALLQQQQPPPPSGFI